MGTRLLYWMSGSPPCWRVMTVLNAKGLSYQGKVISLNKREHKSAEVLAINPRGQVPTFKDGDVIVNDSMAAMQYLEETYPQVPLLPEGKAERALALQRWHEVTSLYNAGMTLFYDKARQAISGVTTDYDREQFELGVEKTRQELGHFEGYLADGRSFLAGDMFTFADISLLTTLYFQQFYGATHAQFPSLTTYTERMREWPSLKETWPPHWLENEGRDWLAEL